MSGYTPGPWYAEHGTEEYFFVSLKGGEMFPREENAANARLIAAAPDLLEALEKIALEGAWKGGQECLRIAAAAIAKARALA